MQINNNYIFLQNERKTLLLLLTLTLLLIYTQVSVMFFIDIQDYIAYIALKTFRLQQRLIN